MIFSKIDDFAVKSFLARLALIFVISNNREMFRRSFFISKWYLSFAIVSRDKFSRLFVSKLQKRQHCVTRDSKKSTDSCCYFISFKKTMTKAQINLSIRLILSWQSSSKIFIFVWRKIIILTRQSSSKIFIFVWMKMMMFLKSVSCDFKMSTKLFVLFCLSLWNKTADIAYTSINDLYIFLYKSKTFTNKTKKQDSMSCSSCENRKFLSNVKIFSSSRKKHN
jgi:hypothetical protein